MLQIDQGAMNANRRILTLVLRPIYCF